jgi:alpha-ketoglutarate-dependent taurine dioxygenase
MNSPRSSRIAGVTRRLVPTDGDLVEIVPQDDGMPTQIRALVPGLDLGTWVRDNLASLREALVNTGAAVLTGFDGARTEQQVQSCLANAGRETLTYRERSTPRRSLAGNVYTSTEYPSDRVIALHCELTAAHVYPELVWFTCIEAPTTGGATPVADTRKVLAELPAELRDRFRRLGWRLNRSYGSGFGPGWQEAMQTESRDEVEEYCHANDIAFRWTGDGQLRTSQVRRAIERHPISGEETWFNHVAFWHSSSFEPPIREQMERELAPDEFPYQVFYGDGSPIADADAQLMREAYARHHRERPWQPGDVMVVDNLLSAHGRAPYTGPRKIVVAMTDAVHRPAFVPNEATR